jgi:hypothetical protein
MRRAWTAIALATLVGCGSKGGTVGHGGASSTTSPGGGGTGGGGTTCPDTPCSAPGQTCVAGACVADCRPSTATPCAADTVCDVSDASPGMCVAPGGACVTTSTPVSCGGKICGPGSACDGNGKCYPIVPCTEVVCDTGGCYGAECACTRAPGCSPAAVGTPGAAGTLQDATFLHGLVDLQFDPTCTAWGVTLVSGPDYLRSVTPSGTVGSIAGVTNLNMGEVAVLQHLAMATSYPGDAEQHPLPRPLDMPGLDVSLTYICCSACGCELQTTPQGVAHLDPTTMQIPLVIPSSTFTNGTGPFGAAVIDTGPAGLSYGTDLVLYVGNVDTNGDYYSLDLGSQKQQLVTTFTARVYASAPFDAVTQIVALEGGELRLLRITDGTSTSWATSSNPVTGLTRDFFDGSVYVARRDGSILRYDAAGNGTPFQTTTSKNPARIAIAPDGFLYALEIPPPFADATPTVERWQLPTTR